MILQQRRLDNGWSQEHLAQASGLSVRTIQRIENGQSASLDSLRALAAVFDTDVATLVREQNMTANDQTSGIPPISDQISQENTSREENQAIEYVNNLKGFHINWICFLFLMPLLYLLNLFLSPEYPWILWAAGGWIIGIALHALTIYGMFNLFGTKWEQRQFEKRLNRNR